MFVKTNNKELPLLFSGPMVLAAMEGIKTVTRQILKPQPPPTTNSFEYVHSNIDSYRSCFRRYSCFGQISYIKAKYARGDRIWARETWGIVSYDDSSGYEITVQYKADNKQSGIIYLDSKEQWGRFISSQKVFEKSTIMDKIKSPILWRSSIYLPRPAARLILDITDVRIERLHGLNDAEARKEGSKDLESFINYWNILNAWRSYPWESNPWVYRIEFKKTV